MRHFLTRFSVLFRLDPVNILVGATFLWHYDLRKVGLHNEINFPENPLLFDSIRFSFIVFSQLLADHSPSSFANWPRMAYDISIEKQNHLQRSSDARFKQL